MNRTQQIAVIVVVVVLVLGVTAWVVVSLLRAPVHSLQARACVGCVETHHRGESRVAANTLTGAYRFRRAEDYLIRFSAGEVLYEGERLEPGCHAGTGERGDTVTFDDAGAVLFQVPAPEDACL